MRCLLEKFDAHFEFFFLKIEIITTKEREEGRGKRGRMKKETEAGGGKRERKKEKSCCRAGTRTRNLGFQDIVLLDF